MSIFSKKLFCTVVAITSFCSGTLLFSAEQPQSVGLWDVFGPEIKAGSKAGVSGLMNAPVKFARNNPKQAAVVTAALYGGYVVKQIRGFIRLKKEVDQTCRPQVGNAYWALENEANENTFCDGEGVNKNAINVQVTQVQRQVKALKKKLKRYTSVPRVSLNQDLNWRWNSWRSSGTYLKNLVKLSGRIMHRLYKPLGFIAASKYTKLQEVQQGLKDLQDRINGRRMSEAAEMMYA